MSVKGKPSESWGRKVTGLTGLGPYDSGIAGLSARVVVRISLEQRSSSSKRMKCARAYASRAA